MFNCLCITGSCDQPNLLDDTQKERRVAAFLKITAFVLGILCVSAAIFLNVNGIYLTAAHSLGSIGGLLMIGSFIATLVHYAKMRKEDDQRLDQRINLDEELREKSENLESLLKRLAAENKVDEIRTTLQEPIPEDLKKTVGGRAYIRLRERAKQSALYHAVLLGHHEIVRLLITEHGINVKMVVDEEDKTFLPTYLIHCAIGSVRDNLTSIKLLLQANPSLLNLRKPKRISRLLGRPYEWNVGYTPLEEALIKLNECLNRVEDPAVLKAKILYLIIEKGAEPNTFSTYPKKTCALYLALESMDIDIIEALSHHGALWDDHALEIVNHHDYQALMHSKSTHERFEKIVKRMQ